MKKVIVIGTGFSGSVIAHELALCNNLAVDVIEQRPHIAGNMYDEVDNNGIIVQKYGPHYFNTYNFKLVNYISQFGVLRPFCVKAMSFIDGKHIRLPWNFQSIQELLPYNEAEVLINKLKEKYNTNRRVPIFSLINSEDCDIRRWGELLFKKAFANYMVKQWGIPAEQVDKSVMNRVPMAMGYDERYLEPDFQFLPVNGFTELFKNMLNHDNITVHLNTNALDHIILDENSNRVLYDGENVDLVIYTGAIDELFNYKYGHLPYRSLEIKYDIVPREQSLPADIVSYPQEKKLTRRTDYGRFNTVKNNGFTVIATEYPLAYDKNAEIGNKPYYPVLTAQNIENFNKYNEMGNKFKNIVFCGRLAEYKYYNMDAAVANALSKMTTIKKMLGI